MAKLSRRAALRGIAGAASALGAGTVAIAAERHLHDVGTLPAAQPETPVSKVNRLAAELAEAMDQWMEDISGPGFPAALWEAQVWPASSGRGVYFRNHDRPGKSTSEHSLEIAAREFIAVAKGIDPSLDWSIGIPEDATLKCRLFISAMRRKAVAS